MIHIVIFITRGDTIGGAQSHTITLAENLVKNNFRVSFIVGGEKGILSNFLENKGYIVNNIKHFKRHISPFYDLISFFEISKILLKCKPDLLSIHSAKAGFIGRIICKLFKIPNVFTVHGWSFTDGIPSPKKQFYIFLEKILSSLSKKIIVVSDYDKKLAIKYRVCSENKLITIHNGIDSRESEYEQYKHSNPFCNVVMVARFEKPKLQKKLILAIKNIDNVHLHLLGDGPDLIVCRKIVEELNLSTKVTFYGHKDDVVNFLHTMDIFVLVSRYEAFPISTLEAMSVGLPILISNVGGTSESVVHGFNGYLLENNDSETIELFLQKLISDNELRRNMGINSRKLFHEKFTSEVMLHKTISVFNDLLNNN